MLIVMKQDVGDTELRGVTDLADELGLKSEPMTDGPRKLVGITGEALADQFLSLPGVADVLAQETSYKLSARGYRAQNTVVTVGEASFGVGQACQLVAGPCSIESMEQAMTVARAVRDAGVRVMRGGLFKPRTSPFSFQGLHEKGAEILSAIRKETGLAIVTEAVDIPSLELIEQYADMIQIGTRNMHNYSLLQRAGKSKLPVMLKRGFSATIDEWLTAADYVLAGGNPNVVLCERGVRTFANHTRFTLDLSAVPAIRERSHLPIIVDPSHATGRRDYVTSMALACVASGADGVMVEVHGDPDAALSDADQSLGLAAFGDLASRMTDVANAVGRG